MKNIKTFEEFVNNCKQSIIEEDFNGRVTEAQLYLYEKLSKAKRDKLPDSDFVFPDKRTWPIHTEKQAKIALVYATWPKNASAKDTVVKTVLKRYPNLKGVGAAK